MSNPIDNGPRISAGQVGSANRSQQTGKGVGSNVSSAARGVSGADAASESERLTLVRERIDSTPDMDMDRVEAIKQAIAEGRFPVDPKRIAAKFVELEGLLKD